MENVVIAMLSLLKNSFYDLCTYILHMEDRIGIEFDVIVYVTVKRKINMFPIHVYSMEQRFGGEFYLTTIEITTAEFIDEQFYIDIGNSN